jgi:diguanylate cyclase (GGDEF)-like protein
MKIFSKIRNQFFILFTFLMISLMSVTLFFVIRHEKEALTEERKLRGLALLRSWSALSKERLITNDVSVELSMYDFMDELIRNEEGIEAIFLQDDQGMVIIHHEPEKNNSILNDSLSNWISVQKEAGIVIEKKEINNLFQLYFPIWAGDRYFGAARINMNDLGIQKAIRDGIWPVIISSSIFMFLGLILLAVMIYRITRPITILTHGAKLIGTQTNEQGGLSLSHTINFKSNNELGTLRDAFNQMTSNLRNMTEEKIRLAAEKKIFQTQATTDALTGLLNKRQFTIDLQQFLENASQKNEPLTMVMMDMDRFKALNDEHGHEAGDQALALLGKCLKTGIRTHDRVYRIGGDEFIILLRHQKPEIAQIMAERIRKTYLEHKTKINETDISLGIVFYNGKDTVKEFFQKADDAMYKVKKLKNSRSS